MTDKILRFDDICGNTDMAKVYRMVEHIKKNVPDAIIWFCVSTLFHDLDNPTIKGIEPAPVKEEHREMVFPPVLCALSDHRAFYMVDRCLVPTCPKDIVMVTHGLVHRDHRLLSYAAQEMSIVTSASLVKSTIFVPPFNKWNEDTEDICDEHGITLVKFEEGWKHMKHNRFDRGEHKYYLHSCDFTIDDFKKWFV
jgi:hypothetical protein